MRFFCLTSMIFFINFAQAQIPKPGDPEYFASGRLITLRIVPKDASAEIYLVGKEALKASWKNQPKVVSVTYIKPGLRKVLEFDDQGTFFRVKNMPAASGPFELRVDTRIQDEIDEITVELVPLK